jgi:hypothetical protein
VSSRQIRNGATHKLLSDLNLLSNNQPRYDCSVNIGIGDNAAEVWTTTRAHCASPMRPKSRLVKTKVAFWLNVILADTH